MASSHEPSPAEGYERFASTAYHDVVMQLESEQPRAGRELPRQMHVLLRGRGIAAWMVVRDDQVGGAFANRWPQYFTRVDDGRGQAAGGNMVMPDQAVLAVEEEDEEVLAPVVRDQAPRDGGSKLWDVHSVPNGGLVLADDGVADVAQIALARCRYTTPPARRARTGLGEMG